MLTTLSNAAVIVLNLPDPLGKVRMTTTFARAWRAGLIEEVGDTPPPDRPARPDRPELKPPRDMAKRRKAGSLAGRIALLHALAHIELNAVDLAWDIVARFADHTEGGERLPRAFFDDWIRVAEDEARHHLAVGARLEELGASYGDLPAHDGLWQASQATAHDLAARLAVVPMVLEARGLDVTPAMIEGLDRQGDRESAAILRTIHDEEIAHVAAGKRWFDWVCARRGADPESTWQDLVRTHFRGELKRPFNEPSRTKADFPPDWYEPLADEMAAMRAEDPDGAA
jgi:uncharacterized ferritin-like protein (DUF455 family)